MDVLFHSAAVHYGAHDIGIILTGMLDDGTSGMSAIKRCGVICIVQEFDQMPQSVINQLSVNFKLKLNDIGNVLAEILEKPIPTQIPIR